MSQTPRLYVGGLTNTVYVATRYKELSGGIVEALEKYDVTDQLKPLLDKVYEQGWTEAMAQENPPEGTENT